MQTPVRPQLWSVRPGPQCPEVWLETEDARGYALCVNYGPIPSVLEDIHTPDALAWRHFHCGLVWDKRSFGTEPHRLARAQKREKDAVRNAAVCNLWLETFGLRPRDCKLWRALSLNAALHPQFGPCYTAATNGVDVILVSAPSLTADWLLAHRSNVIGPVTGSEVLVSEWDWLSNAKAQPQATRADGSPVPSRKALLATL